MQGLSIPVFRGLTLLVMQSTIQSCPKCGLSIPVFRGLTLLDCSHSGDRDQRDAFNPRF
jgi:predicted nucleic acid-binding Zn ribbon protein